MKTIIYDSILESYEAAEMAKDFGISEEEAAANFFDEICEDGRWEEQPMPEYNEYKRSTPNGNLYYDYGADYYFFIKSRN